MFGLIHECTKQLVIKLFGEDAYKEMLSQTGFALGKENIFHFSYSDNDTYAIVDSICRYARLTRDEVWDAFGVFFVEWIMNQGWEEMLRCLSPDLKGFVNNLDSLHYFVDHVVYKANLKGPSFRCEVADDETITLHYFSERTGLYPIVKGIIREIGRKLYNLEVTINVVGRTQRSIQMVGGERTEEHVIFLIKHTSIGLPLQKRSLASGTSLEATEREDISKWTLRVSQSDFHTILPYHFIIDRDCRLIQIGAALASFFPADQLKIGTPVIKLFEIQRPQVPLDFENILNFINGVFVLQVRSFARSPLPGGSMGSTKNLSPSCNSSLASPYLDNDSFTFAPKLKLKGQMMVLSAGDQVIYLCSPYVTNINEVLSYGLRMNSFPLHDATRDLVLLNQQRLSDVDDNIQLEANNEQLEQMAREIEEEKKRNDALLKEVLPVAVAEQLMSGESVDAREYPIATVMFADCPSFQKIVPQCRPSQIAYKVETVGDSYMTSGGVPDEDDAHCEKLCHIALGFLWEARTTIDPINNERLDVRCGIHSGPVVAGVVGAKMPRFCLFGDTVNTASRMESHSLLARVHCSAAAKKCAEESGRFEFASRGIIPIKGKGLMETYFLRKSLKKSVWEIVGRQRDVNIHSIDGYVELETGIEEDLQKALDQTKSSKSCALM